MENKESLTSEYFDKVYAANDDPWNFQSSEYEAEKYSSTIEALPEEKYNKALEIGCSIGVLTKLLAEKCSQLLATDVSAKALEQAKERCNDLNNVEFQILSFPQDLPDEKFDLIVVSEVAYYLAPEDWKSAIEKMQKILNKNGEIILVHWLPEVHDYPQTGDEVHHTFSNEVGAEMKNIFTSRAEKYRIDIWKKVQSW